MTRLKPLSLWAGIISASLLISLGKGDKKMTRPTQKFIACLSVSFFLIATMFVLTPFATSSTSGTSDPIRVSYGSLEEYPGNAVIMNNASTVAVKDPSILFSNGWYYMAYSAIRANGTAYVAMSKSTDFHVWTYMGMIIGNNYSWSDNNAGAPDLFASNGKFYCYFQARNSSTSTWAIGVAETTNISNPSSWIQYVNNPIFLGNWSENYVAYDPSVIQVGASYYMYYVSSMDGVRAFSLATSSDHYNFTRIVNGVDGTARVITPVTSYVTGPEAPSVSLLPDGTYMCLMTDWNASVEQITAVVYSSDGLTWTALKKTNTPFLTGLHAWDDSGCSSPTWFATSNQLLVAYQGDSGSDTWLIGVAHIDYTILGEGSLHLPSDVHPYITLILAFVALAIAMPVVGLAIQSKDKQVSKKDVVDTVIFVVIGCVLMGVLIRLLGS
jgi:hypothetical protein